MAFNKIDINTGDKNAIHAEIQVVKRRIEESSDLPALKAYRDELIAAYNGDVLPGAQSSGGTRAAKKPAATVDEVVALVAQHEATALKAGDKGVKGSFIADHFGVMGKSCSRALQDATRPIPPAQARLTVIALGKGKDNGNRYTTVKQAGATGQGEKKGK